ncbi:MAG: PA14 domain-containing protein [Bacteroidota bacterium]
MIHLFLLMRLRTGIFSVKKKIALIAFFVTNGLLVHAQGTVTFNPSQTPAFIASQVSAKDTGTTFIFTPGLYRMLEIKPNNGQKFIGQSGAILNGSRQLKSWVKSGNYWVHGGQTQKGQATGECVTGNACQFPEDLFVNNLPLKRVESKSAVQSGSWYFNYDHDSVYVYQDVDTTATIEVGVSRSAFKAEKFTYNVIIKHLIVEKYAIPAQFSAIGDINTAAVNPLDPLDKGQPARNWIIDSCEVRWNHGGGINFYGQAKVRGNYAHHNGQFGLGGGGDGALVENNEIAYNNQYVGFNSGWAAGGTKFASSTNLTVRKNKVHHNNGPGLWTDISNLNTLYEENVCTDNQGAGIFHEISYDAIIRCNTLSRNKGNNGQLYISTSSNVDVYNNIIIADDNSSGAITGGQSNRIDIDKNQRWLGRNNYVHHNDITFLNNSQLIGLTASYDATNYRLTGNARFDYNTYHMPDSTQPHFIWAGNTTPTAWTTFKAQGQETWGRVDNNLNVTPAVNCTNPISFYRAINLNGSAITADGITWEASSSATNFSYTGSLLTAQTVPLQKDSSRNQNVDANRASLIRSSISGVGASITLSSVPTGYYNVYLYIWESNSSKTYSIFLEGKNVLNNYQSGVAGRWLKLGPLATYISDGTINVTTSGGIATLSGIEVRKVNSLPNSAAIVSITAPTAYASFVNSSNITINTTATDADGNISKVEFFQGNTSLGVDLSSPYSFTWNSVTSGNYTLTAKATDNRGAVTTSRSIDIIVTPPYAATGTITREVWSNVSGQVIDAAVLNVFNNTPPTSTSQLTLLEGPTNAAENYASRIRGYVCPPVSGNYTFWIAGDNNCELYLSTSDDPNAKTKIAYLTGGSGWTSPREWIKYPSQQSAPIALVAGQKYYLEVLHKEGAGNDNLAVGWQLPDGTYERPIGANRLIPYKPATGTILREFWANVSGQSIDATVLNVFNNTPPTSTSQLTLLEGPTSAGDNYASRIRGYIHPPVSGNYTFWIAGDNNCEAWLSTSESRAAKIKIAFVNGYTSSREWTKFPSQVSVPISLTGGKRYYIEILHKEGTSDDNLSVGWQLPSGVYERPIPGHRLSPYLPGGILRVAHGELEEEVTETGFKLYPNPFESNFTIDQPNSWGGKIGVTFFDQLGKIHYQGEYITKNGEAIPVDLFNQSLKPGLFFVRVTTSNGQTKTFKVYKL